MIVMDRSTSLTNSGSCAPLKAAAVNFVEKFAESRDNLGLVTFATSSRVDVHLTTTFKTPVETTLNSVICSGATNSSQALVAELPGAGWAGADGRAQRHPLLHGRPADGRDGEFSDQERQRLHHHSREIGRCSRRVCNTLGWSRTRSAVCTAGTPLAQPMASDLAVIVRQQRLQFLWETEIRPG